MAKPPTRPMTNVASSLVGRSLSESFRNFNPLGFVSDLAQSYSEIQKQTTERTRITAEKQIRLAEIEAKRQIFLDYLDKAFAERADNFRRLFRAVDVAMENDNNEQLAATLSSITELAKSTPFKDLVDINKTREILSDPTQVWEI